ncbi:MAG: carboxypeptidase regulatory-like domain-containing protein [Bacteroidota bacterium]
MIKALILVTIILLSFGSLIQAGDITGKIETKKTKYKKNAVVYIEKIEGKKFDPPKEHQILDQKNLTFVPHVLPVLTGTTVDFQNSDDVLHNVFSPDDCAEKFNLGSWPKGEKRSHTFDEPGCLSVVLCNVHPEMEGYVVVVETPYYAVTDEEGNYTINNVPDGEYTLKIWHERLKGEEQVVTIPKTGSATANFELKR